MESAVKNRKLSLVLCDDLERWDGSGGEGGSRGVYIYVYIYIYVSIYTHIADSLHCKAKANTT